MRLDHRLLPVAEALRDCLCTGLEARGGPPCFCSLLPGGIIPADFCGCAGTGGGCGMAWVRIGRLFLTTNGVAQASTPGNCSATVAAVIELGVLRCLPQVAQDGTLPDDVAETGAVLSQQSDAAAMYEAITCCTALDFKRTIVGAWAPLDSGDCGGGTWPLTVLL